MKKTYITPETTITSVEVEHFIAASPTSRFQSGIYVAGGTAADKITIPTKDADLLDAGSLGQSDDGSGNRAKGNTIWDSWDEE